MAATTVCKSSRLVSAAPAVRGKASRSVTVPSAKLAKTSSVHASKAAAAAAAVAVAADSMQVWQPTDNKMFETFSYLPPLSDEQIADEVDYIVSNGWIPALEFSEPALAYIGSQSTSRFGAVSAGYYDNRYWTMWKLPMFGCADPLPVLREIVACTRAFPSAYIRLVAFDNVRQVQIMSFLVHRPSGAQEFTTVDKRSVA